MALAKKYRDRIWNILIVENRHIAKQKHGERHYWEAGNDDYLINAVIHIAETLQGETK